MDKKNKIKAGLIFGIAMTIFFILQDLMTHVDLTTKNIITFIISGLFGGALAGLLFGWLTGLFSNSKFFTRETKIDTDEDEDILFQTPANHFKGIEAVGGKLYLTNKRLLFKSHKLNIQNHQLSLNITDIQKVERHKTMGLVDNDISVTTINGSTEKFVVEQPDAWFNYLTDKNGLQQKYLQ